MRQSPRISERSQEEGWERAALARAEGCADFCLDSSRMHAKEDCARRFLANDDIMKPANRGQQLKRQLMGNGNMLE